MSLVDVDHQLLPDSLVLPLLWLGLIIIALAFTSLENVTM
jgi:leader peptidase (prepilin peptidase)/N-methyltransferase